VSEGDKKKTDKVNIGTSGWHYKHWVGNFYPQDLNKNNWLSFYADRFHTVEINNSFYRLPKEETFKAWRKTVPNKFTFAVKASRFITHMKKLKDPEEPIQTFMDRAKVLEEKLGPILFQLPPRWKFNPERLENFLKALPKKFLYACEFRDPSWFTDQAYQILADNEVSFCIYQMGDKIAPKQVTTDFIYLRMHSPADASMGEFGRSGLSQWADDIQGWIAEGKTVYCYFNNDPHGHAIRDAVKLREMVAGTED
jgi:uncharacterized protein YecE (DUF72 family)